ncbi:MAG: hypothetical protein IPK87_03490 [Planctomycetes bacterium]|nr:hypothetical protein [Planctomycetota bacterium]
MPATDRPLARRWRLPFAAGALLWLGMMLGGCAYTWSASLDGNETRNLSLDTVENRTFPHRPGMEYELTRRLKDEIATDRRFRLTEGATDVKLKVSLVRVTEPNLVEDFRTGEPAEILLRATAVVEATGDAFPTGRSKRTITVSTSYTPGLGDSRRAGLDRLWRDLSREILDVAADIEWAPRSPVE